MPKRISKLLLPHPMPHSFARELCLLMTGYDDTTAPGRFGITRILDAAWSADKAISLVTVYHQLNKAAYMPSVAALRETASVPPENAFEFREALQTLSTLLDQLPDDPGELSAIKELVATRWMQAIRSLAAGKEPLSSQLDLLLGSYGVFSASGEPQEGDGFVVALDELAEAKAEPKGVHYLSLLAGPSGVGHSFVHEMLSAMGKRAGPPRASLSAPAVDPTRPALSVYKQADAVSLVQRLPAVSAPGDGNAQQRRLLEAMADNDGLRKLVEVPEGQPLQELYSRFPHFSEVLQSIERSLALASCGDEGRPVRIPPILLKGEAGTGKTFFAQELARVLGLHFLERDLNVTSEAFVLAGMDAGWKNSKPGIVFDALVNGNTANPLILLNEVDKVATKEAHNSPMAPLYSLLEPTSSSHFNDEFVPVNLNASSVIWVLTANEGFIPEPILSRLEVFNIRTPNEEECRLIATSVWSSICARSMPKGHGFCESLGEPMLALLGKMNPRGMRRMLTRAAGSAALQGRKYLLLEDLEGSMNRDQANATRHPMGFMQ